MLQMRRLKTEQPSNLSKDRESGTRTHTRFLSPAILCKKEEEATAELTNSLVMSSHAGKRKVLVALSAYRGDEQVSMDAESQVCVPVLGYSHLTASGDGHEEEGG